MNKALTRGNPKKRNLLGPKKRGGRPGRDPRPSAAEQDSHALALKLGRSALGKSVLRYMEALDATKPIYMKADDGEGSTAYIPGESIPDHAVRIRAADAICDRFGVPKKIETESNDPFSGFMVAVAASLKETNDAP